MVLFVVLACPARAQDEGLWKRYYDSTQYYWGNDWPKTVALLEFAERSALADLGLYDENYLTILNDLGTAYWKSGQYPKAEQALSKSLALKTEVYAPFDKEVILSMSNLAGFYAERGSWKKSKTLYHQIIGFSREQVPADIYVDAAQNLVSLFDLNHQPDSAYVLLNLIEKWNLIEPGTDQEFQHQFYRARILRQLRDYETAQAELDKLFAALSGKPESRQKRLLIQSLQEQGVLHLETGAYSQAEKVLLQGYQTVASDNSSSSLLTELSNNLAHIYDKLNISDKALVYYQESLNRCQQSYAERSLPCVTLENNIAGVHLKQNNFPEAVERYQKVIASLEKLVSASDPLYITAVNNLATAYRKTGQFRLALEHLEKAETLLTRSGMTNDDLAATVLNNIAVINTAEGDHTRAAEHYKKAYAIKRSIYGENSILLVDLVNNLAVTYWTLGKPREAIPLLKKSNELATRQIAYVFPNLNENEQVQFYEKLREDFERFNSIAIQWRDKDASLISQMFRNRTIIKSLQFFTQQRRSNSIAIKNDAALNQLVAQVKECRDRLGHYYQLPLNQLDQREDVLTLEKKVDSLEKILSLRSTAAYYTDGLAVGEVGWQSLVSKLKPDEAIVEMVRFRQYDRILLEKKSMFGFTDSVHYAALILTRETKSAPEVVLLENGNGLETRYYNYYRNALRYNVEDHVTYRSFWEPIAEKLAGKTRVFLSADGVYHKINVNTLWDDRSKKFVLDKFDVVYLLNPMQALQQKPSGERRKRDAVLMGDPVFDIDLNKPRDRTVGPSHFVALPGTQEELRAIEKVLKTHSWKTSLYVKAAATEANLKSIVSPSILHVASHGFFSSDVVPLNATAKKEFLFHSGIVLTGANESLSTGSTTFNDDGIVTAFEVMNLDLTNTELVVLSACETGLGKIENGEGVFGLQRSFMQAGAQSVLISLWKVDDEATRDLMIKFYEYLVRGETLHNALRKCQTDQARLLYNPSLWGGFVLVGNN